MPVMDQFVNEAILTSIGNPVRACPSVFQESRPCTSLAVCVCVQSSECEQERAVRTKQDTELTEVYRTVCLEALHRPSSLILLCRPAGSQRLSCMLGSVANRWGKGGKRNPDTQSQTR